MYFDGDIKTDLSYVREEFRRQQEEARCEVVARNAAAHAGIIAKRMAKVVPYAGTESAADAPRSVIVRTDDWVNRPA